MSIVHIISTLNIGGAENFVVQLANEQAKHQSVTIILLRDTNIERNYIKNVKSSIDVFQLDWKKKYSLIQLFQLMILLKKIMPQIVHVHLHNPFYYVFALSIFNKKIRYVHTIHSSFKNWKKVLGLANKLRFLSHKILHVCLSNSIAEKIGSAYPNLYITVIPNGIESYQLSRSKDEIKQFWKSFKSQSKEGFKFLAIGNIFNTQPQRDPPKDKVCRDTK